MAVTNRPALVRNDGPTADDVRDLVSYADSYDPQTYQSVEKQGIPRSRVPSRLALARPRAAGHFRVSRCRKTQTPRRRGA